MIKSLLTMFILFFSLVGAYLLGYKNGGEDHGHLEHMIEENQRGQSHLDF